VVGFYDILGPAGGIIECEIDGRKYDMARFDKYCTFNRIGYRMINVDDGVHRVKFTWTAREIDKARILKEGGIEVTDMAIYNEKIWYVGGLMLIGDLINSN
jgi:hypothetical protein